MISLRNYPVKVVSTGFVVLVLLSLPLFWARSLCEMLLRDMMLEDARGIAIRPSGLVPPEIENDPNVADHSCVSARMNTQGPFNLGISDYFQTRMPGGSHSNVYYYEDNENMLYFDEEIGLFVHKYTYHKQSMPDKSTLIRKAQLYAGPEGVSETPDKTLGGFITPIEAGKWYWRPEPEETYRTFQTRVVFDKKLRRFFNIDFHKRTIVKGPELGKDDPHKPLQIGILIKNPSLLNLSWSPPRIKVSKPRLRREEEKREVWESIIERYSIMDAGEYLHVLDESGRIDLLDRETLEFAGTAGWLPAPETFSPSKGPAKPTELLSYQVRPVAFNPYSKYRGMCAASVSREGTSMAVAVFDEKGNFINRDHTKAIKYARHIELRRHGVPYIPSSRAVFFEVPWAPALTIAKYLAENLQPTVLSIASYFTADSFEATTGHRALFILPNSFVAMRGRKAVENEATGFLYVLLLISPSIILGIYLSFCVGKDATAVGLSENIKLCWIIGTIVFGLTGYITYRLTRPKLTLVTCSNCGQLRRPDMDRCHHCGSKWQVPELTPPIWRVIDRP